jgi:polysaccharide pyruvyl transferase WcaK-like protein
VKVLISDAYSPTNIGDGELVRLSISSVLSRYGVQPIVLCTDKDGFESDPAFDGSRFLFKPLSRVRWRALGSAGRLSMLLRDASGMLLALILGFLPLAVEARRTTLRGLARVLRLPWLTEVSCADVVVGVGGGYLGDKYLRESIMSLGLFRVATSLSVDVETMPLSVSSATHPALRMALKVFGRGVSWRSRERTTQNILSSLGLHSECVPDLAWLNSSMEHCGVVGATSLALAPLGSDFYGADGPTEPKIWSHIQEHVAGLEPGERVSLIAMHYWDERLRDGRDDLECERVADLIRLANPRVDVTVLKLRSYDEVLLHMAATKLAVCERLHAALAGLAVGTQTKVVGYEPKHRGVLELAGLHVLADESISFIRESVAPEFIAARGANQATLAHRSVMEA